MRVYGIIGWKNSGKTTLMERLVATVVARGFTVSTVKHVHHDVDLDRPGKDTYRHRAAGAQEVVLASAHRFALMREHRGPEPDLATILTRLAPVDLVLVEGYKRDAHPKIEVHRLEPGHPLIQPTDPLVRAVATDAGLTLPVPVLDLNDAESVADFILHETGLSARASSGVAPQHLTDRNSCLFDTVAVVDWSALTVPSPARKSKDAIWLGIARPDGEETHYFRTRAAAEAGIAGLLDREPGRVLLGFDFPMAYPKGFGHRLTGQHHPRAVWDWLAAEVADSATNANNRLDVATRINVLLGGAGPFWVVNQGLAREGLPWGKIGKVDFAALGLAELRAIESSRAAGQPKSVWQLTGPGSVGSQVLTGLPVIARLARRPDVAVWPFANTAGSRVVVAEVYPSLLSRAVAQSGDKIRDRAQVRLLARALLRLSQSGRLAPLFEVPEIAREEGWILGAGHQAALEAALG